MRRWHFLVAFVFFVTAVPAKAKDFYITQAGRGTGVSCSNPLSVAWFNNTANWGTGLKQISPGTTVHLCGTFTGALGQQLLVVRRSGTSSAPITIKFESGAKLTSPAWSGMGAIYASNLSYIVVDGGGTGVIQNTANGTTLGHRQSSVGVYARNCTGCTVKNITIANLYVHRSVSDTTVAAPAVNCVSFVSSNSFTINHVTCREAGWAFAGMGNNFTLAYSDISNIDHGLAFGAAGTTSGFSIHDNHIHGFAVWDTSANTYHHDGIHMWGRNGGKVTHGSIYNNRFDGDSGVNITGDIYLQDTIQYVAVYNNVFAVPTNRINRAIWLAALNTSMGATGNSAYNNTINAGSHIQGSALMIQAQLGFKGYNNMLMGGQSDVAILNGGTLSSLDNNVYVDLASVGSRSTFGYQGKSYQTLTQWKSVCRCDAHSRFVLPTQVRLSSTGQIMSYSTTATVSAGTNLTSLATGDLSTLSTDILGAPRPTSGSWDAGAYQSGSTPTKPAPVNGVTATVQ